MGAVPSQHLQCYSLIIVFVTLPHPHQPPGTPPGIDIASWVIESVGTDGAVMVKVMVTVNHMVSMYVMFSACK